MKPKSPRNNTPHCFRENERGLVAITFTSQAVVTATKLWLVLLVSEVCEFHHDSEIGR